MIRKKRLKLLILLIVILLIIVIVPSIFINYRISRINKKTNIYVLKNGVYNLWSALKENEKIEEAEKYNVNIETEKVTEVQTDAQISSNPFLSNPESTGIVKSGSGDIIGYYSYISMARSEFDSVTPELKPIFLVASSVIFTLPSFLINSSSLSNNSTSVNPST